MLFVNPLYCQCTENKTTNNVFRSYICFFCIQVRVLNFLLHPLCDGIAILFSEQNLFFLYKYLFNVLFLYVVFGYKYDICEEKFYLVLNLNIFQTENLL